jgi:hypothetical protein
MPKAYSFWRPERADGLQGADGRKADSVKTTIWAKGQSATRVA